MKTQIIDTLAYNETELLNKAQANDHQAFEIIIKHYELEIYNYIFKHTYYQQDALDLLQETMIKAFRNIQKYNPEYSLRSWLYQIAKHLIIDESRKKANKTRKLCMSIDNPDVHIVCRSKKSVEHEVEYYSLQEALAQAITKLPPKLSNIIILCDIQELSYNEAAEIEGIKIGTVKSRLNRAHKTLKRMKYLKDFL